MFRSSLLAAAVVPFLFGVGCGFFDSEAGSTPEIPDDFPQVGETKTARVEVVIDGNAFSDTGLCDHGPTLESGGPRFTLSAGGFEVSVRGRDERSYSSAADEVTASWFGAEEDSSSADCGESVVRFVGEDIYDAGTAERVATWGTLQLVLCSDEGLPVEVSGKFSCLLDG